MPTCVTALANVTVGVFTTVVPPGASRRRADVHDRGRSGGAAGAEVHGLGDAGGRRPGAHSVGRGRRGRADAGGRCRDGDRARGGQSPRKRLVAGEGLRAREDRQLADEVLGSVKLRVVPVADARQREQRPSSLGPHRSPG